MNHLRQGYNRERIDPESGQSKFVHYVTFHNGYTMTYSKYYDLVRRQEFRRNVINRHYGLVK